MVPFVIGAALEAMTKVSSAQPRGGDAAGHAEGGRVGRGVRRIPDTVRAGVGAVVALACISPLAPWAPDEVRFVDVVRPAPSQVARAVAEVRPGEIVSTTNVVAGQLAHREQVYVWPCPFPDAPGRRRCSHPNLFPRAADVEVVVLPYESDLSGLPGDWTVRHVDGITIARRHRHQSRRGVRQTGR